MTRPSTSAGEDGRGHLPIGGHDIFFTQINLQHSKVASAAFTRDFAMKHTAIALVQEPWVHKDIIRGLNRAGSVFRAAGSSSRTCIVVRGLTAELVQEHTSRDLTTVRVNLGGVNGFRRR